MATALSSLAEPLSEPLAVFGDEAGVRLGHLGKMGRATGNCDPGRPTQSGMLLFVGKRREGTFIGHKDRRLPLAATFQLRQVELGIDR